MRKPRILSPDSLKGTKRRRSAELAGIREVVSGGQEAAMAQPEEETGKEKSVNVTTTDALILKSQLSLPWNKLREMRRYYTAFHFCTLSFTISRYLNTCGIQLPSERKQRKLSHEILGGNLKPDAAPFSFSLKNGGEEVRPAPLVYVPDLEAMIFRHLDQNDRYGTHSMHTCSVNHTLSTR